MTMPTLDVVDHLGMPSGEPGVHRPESTLLRRVLPVAHLLPAGREPPRHMAVAMSVYAKSGLDAGYAVGRTLLPVVPSAPQGTVATARDRCLPYRSPARRSR